MGETEPDRERIMSESATEITEADATTKAAETAQTETSTTGTAGEKDWQAEAEKWKSFARKHEEAAKVNSEKAKRLDEFEESQKSEMQKAADAAATAKADADATRAELARMQAAVKHGLSEDDLDLLGTHGTPDEIGARAERLATRLKAADAAKGKPDFGGGDRGTDVTAKGKQLTGDDVKSMTPDQIVEAQNDGRLNDLLGIK